MVDKIVLHYTVDLQAQDIASTLHHYIAIGNQDCECIAEISLPSIDLKTTGYTCKNHNPEIDLEIHAACSFRVMAPTSEVLGLGICI